MAGNPGDFLSPDMWPLFLQSGMVDAPPQGRTAPPGLDMEDPFARAAYRQQQAVQPDFGRAGEGPSIPGVMSNLIPGGMFSRAVQAFPKTAAATLGLTALGASTSEAGEQPFSWEDSNKTRLQRLKEIDKEIEKEASRSTKSAPGTQAKRIDSLNSEKQQLLTQQNSDMEGARSQWLTQLEADRSAAAEKKRQNTSFFDMIPGTRSAISAAMPVVSYLGGKYMGKRLPVAGAMTAGAVGGGLEGALSQYVPTEVDMGLPRDAPARQAAAQDLQDPAYWGRLAAMAGGNAGLGAFGAFRGAMGRRMPLPPIPPPSSAGGMPPAGPLPMAPSSPTLGAGAGMQEILPPLPTSPAPKSLAAPTGPLTWTSPDGTILQHSSRGWRMQKGQPGAGQLRSGPSVRTLGLDE